jgi:8-oxo-dGTP pyrophosphatase MutT (NUDIX family)
MFDEKHYRRILETMASTLPRTSDGRIDYTNAERAAVLTIFIKHDNKILLLKRSHQVLTYKGKWNTVAGYLDEIVPIHKKIYEELHEELNIQKNDICTIQLGSNFEFVDHSIHRTWIVFPVLVTLRQRPDIDLDWEHTDYQWIDPEKIDDYETVPNILTSFHHSIHGELSPIK